MPLFFERNGDVRLLENGHSHPVSRAEAAALGRPAAGPTYVVGLDLGTVDDYSALSVLEVTGNEKAGEARYVVSHLERWRQVSYPRIAEEVIAIMAQPSLRGAELLLDATGCGLPVLQMVRRMGQSCTGITITAGDQSGTNAAGLTVPKASLVSALQVVVQTHRIKVAPQLPTGRLLANEMAAFQRRQNAVTGHNQFAVWRENEHDDLTLSVCLPIWRTECTTRVTFI